MRPSASLVEHLGLRVEYRISIHRQNITHNMLHGRKGLLKLIDTLAPQNAFYKFQHLKFAPIDKLSNNIHMHIITKSLTYIKSKLGPCYLTTMVHHITVEPIIYVITQINGHVCHLLFIGNLIKIEKFIIMSKPTPRI